MRFNKTMGSRRRLAGGLLLGAALCVLPIRSMAQQGASSDDSPKTGETTEKLADMDLDGSVWVRVKSLTGIVRDFDEESVYVELIGHPGSRIEVDRDLIPPAVIYTLVRRSLTPEDLDGWMALAGFAGDKDLHQLRIDALQQARRHADSEEEIDRAIEESRVHCAEARLSRARELRDAGEHRRAIRVLRETLSHYDSCAKTGEVRRLLNSMLDEHRKGRREAEEKREKTRRKDREWRRFDAIADLISEGEKHLEAGRRALDDSVDAGRHLERSVALFERASALLDRVPVKDDAKTAPSDPGKKDKSKLEKEGYATKSPAREKKRLNLLLEDNLLEARSELGHLYIARGDLESAREQIGLAAVIDSSDWRVSLLRKSIAAASADDRDRAGSRRSGLRGSVPRR